MKNPFAYGEEVSGEAFCNRIQEIQSLLADIRSGQNIIIYSPRRYGKTSLIKEALRKAEKEGILTIYTDLYAVLKEEDFISMYASAIAKSLAGPMEKIVDTLKGLFKAIRPKITINPMGEAEFGVELTQDTDLMIEDVANTVKRFSDKTKKTIVVVFDEFQQTGLLGTDRLERKLRGIIQTHGRNISYVFMGSKKHLLQDMFSNPNKPFYKIGRHFPLDKIGAEELVKFITERFKATRKSIPRDMAKKIVEITECHPYYVQHLSSSVWKLTEDIVTEEIVIEALNLTLSEEKSAYTNLWDELSLNQKKTLRMLAEVGKTGRIYSRDVLRRHGLSAAATQKTIKGLLEKDILDKPNGSYEVTDIFFKLWILRTLSAK